ncbi:hypothetical protein BSL78_21208 [Apostichopus japonicus]|uniref:Uncharacterized protein n=1 Tax=Stichopus japonicus TaxID=307972 RepID=A0A2G8K1W8_STIJA|nr:hypothetical protein BSL78_21208 [Apostichopus japonicus]
MGDSESDKSSAKDATDDAATLKRSCSGYVGRLGRHYKELEILLATYSNHEEVNAQNESLKGLFCKYEARFNEYLSTLEGSDVQAASDQFELNQNNYQEFQKRVSEWLDAAVKKADDNAGDQQAQQPDDVSVRSSSGSRRSGASVTPSVRLKEAKIKRDLARLRKQQLEEAQRIKRQQLDLEMKLDELQIQHDISKAEVEVQAWEEESAEYQIGKPPQVKVTEQPVSKLDPNAKEWTVVNLPRDVNEGENSQSLLHAVSTLTSMPKPELLTFSGDPITYCGFMNNFEVNIGSTGLDSRTKLTYLIQLCEGKAKESIEDCVLLDPAEGYQRARNLLQEQFGQPHVICHCLLNKVLNGPQIRPNDGESLRTWVD